MSDKQLYPPYRKTIFRDQLVTIGDLETFKTDLFLAIKNLLSENKQIRGKKWLKTYEVKKMLNISTGTLQTIRSNGTIPYSKVGSIIYYDAEEIDKVIEDQKTDNFQKYTSKRNS